MAQTALHLADEYLKRHDLDAARAVLLEAHRGTRELSRQGWEFLSIGCLNREQLLALGVQAFHQTPVRIRFLNSAQLWVGDTLYKIGRRQAECLLLISTARNGVTLSELADQLSEGSAVNLSSIKATITRLRAVVPISRNPYALKFDFSADYLEVLEHIRAGRLHDAVLAFRGQLLPESNVTAVVELREQISESLRRALMASGDALLMLNFAGLTGNQDLELLEAAATRIENGSPHSHYLGVRIERLRLDWGLS